MKNKLTLAPAIVLLTIISILFPACSKDPCKDQFCLNGGTCVDGTCECDNGFEGVHCEIIKGYNCKGGQCEMAEDEGTYRTLNDCLSECGKGYVCLNGVCTFTPSNAVYANESECNDHCGGAGYKCINGICTYTNSRADFKSSTACESSMCGKVVPSIIFTNNGWTTMTLTLNGNTRIIAPDGITTFTGSPGQILTGSAFVCEYFKGMQVGQSITINVSQSIPQSGVKFASLDVPAPYFHLTLKNGSAKVYDRVVINPGSINQSSVTAYLSSNDLSGNVFGLGYHVSESNTEIRAYYTNSSYHYWTNGKQFTLSFGSNSQVYVQSSGN